MGRTCNVLILNRVVYIVTTGLQRVKQNRVKPYVVMIFKVLLRTPEDKRFRAKQETAKENTALC